MTRRPRGRRLLRWLAWLAIVLAVLGALPFLLTLLYRWEAVHPVSTLMLARQLTGEDVRRDWVEIEDVSPALVTSVIMSEDGQYCAHRGVDMAELNKVIDDAMAGEPTRGASTIAMQTAKNLFLWNSRSFVRKALEIPLALWLDRVLRKKRLMEVYLNIAEWGPGIFGIEAAAQHHFGKSAKALGPREAALLTVALPNPILRDPGRPSRGLARLAGLIERRARRAGGYSACTR